MLKCVHTEHCCVLHGCKYGEEDSCPVWLGYRNQSRCCENCDDRFLVPAKIGTITEEELTQRRNFADDRNPFV